MSFQNAIRYVFPIAAFCALPLSAAAQVYPNKPVRVAIQNAPGGSAEAAARIMTQGLTEIWGKPVIIEYKPGAGGMLAGSYIAKAAPDGYTLLSGYKSLLISPLVSKDPPPYNILKSFTPISLVMEAPQILVVPASMPVKTLRDLVNLARANPNKLNFGSSGMGGSQHILAEMLKDAEKIEAVHVPFKGSSEVVAAMLSGQVHYSITDSSAKPLILAGKLRALALTGVRRWSALPDVPTMAEAGVQGLDSSSWNVYLAPANLPAPLVRQINSALVKVLQRPESLERLTNAGYTPIGSSAAEAQQYIEREHARYARVIKQMGLKAAQ